MGGQHYLFFPAPPSRNDIAESVDKDLVATFSQLIFHNGSDFALRTGNARRANYFF
jgi:hypothetical protein